MGQNTDVNAEINQRHQDFIDEELELSLKKLKSYSLQELTELQFRVATKLTEATEAFNSAKTEINQAKRRYYLRIFVEVLIEVWRFFRGKDPRATKTKLKQKKEKLKAEFEANYQELHENLSVVQAALDQIQNDTQTIDKLERQLHELQTQIELADQQLQDLDQDADVRSDLLEDLDPIIEKRDGISQAISYCYKNIEGLVNSLSDNLSASLPKSYVTQQKEAHQLELDALKKRAEAISHPVTEALQTFLRHQTDVSLQALKQVMVKDNSYERNQQISDLIWDASMLFPAITSSQNRAEVISQRLANKAEELMAVRASIEIADVNLHQKENKDARLTIDNLIKKSDAISMEINNLVIAHQGILSTTHAPVLEKIQALDGVRADQSKVAELKDRCDQVNHPVATKLRYYLTYRTDVSLSALRETLAIDDSYHESRELINLLWDAGKVDTRITQGMAEEVELPSINEIQDSIDSTVAEKTQILNESLENLMTRRIAIIAEIARLKEEHTDIRRHLTKLAGLTVDAYIPAAVARQLKNSDAAEDYLNMTQDMKEIQKEIKELKEEQAEIEESLHELGAAKETYPIKRIVFTSDILRDLIAKCERENSSNRLHPVVTALHHFLNYPTTSLLMKLKTAMHEQTDYKTHANIGRLLSEAHQYFPYILHDSNVRMESNKFGFFERKSQNQAIKNQQTPGLDDDQEDLGPSDQFKL